ncbi:hypothetical protein [Fodinibius sp. Rm-B-1B1-1]|uniref:hypothetical protein n=1 Tax=Fodinibius alkaliphilus TaxID=3140241 RepID=UPI00315B3440
MLNDCPSEQQQKIEIAVCFHDIEIWTEEIKVMILRHHKIRKIEEYDSPLIELFRKGDVVDFSLGLVRFGLPKE